jgi:hypothetical protein
MLAAITHMYLESLQDDDHGYSYVTPAQIVAHLVTEYGLIEPEDLEANETQLSALWNPDTAIVLVFNNARRCQKYAAKGGDPISDPMLARKVLKVFQASGASLRTRSQGLEQQGKSG